MRRRYRFLTTLGLAALATTGSVLADTTAAPTAAPAPAAAYPPGYVNPFDPNWWLAAFGAMSQVYAVPGSSGYAAPTAPAAPQAASPAPQGGYPAGYVNPFDPNWWLGGWAAMMNAYTVPAAGAPAAPPAPAASAAPTAPAASGQSAPAPVAGSPYVPAQTPYGPVYIFNFADPAAWNKLFAQPFSVPGQAPAKP